MTNLSDSELISYCELHCETPVALFSPEQINRMLALAGHPEGYVRSTDRWLSLGSDMENLCALARERLKAPAVEAVQYGGAVRNISPDPASSLAEI